MSTVKRIKAEEPEEYTLPEDMIFDFSRMTYREGEELQKIAIRKAHAARDGDLEAYQKACDEDAAEVSKRLRSLPRAWLVEGAPEDIDWTDPNSMYDYLRFDYRPALLKAWAYALNNPSKN